MNGVEKDPTPGYVIREILTPVHKKHIRGYFITKLFVMIEGMDTMTHPSLECYIRIKSNKVDIHTIM